jgi:hypothetical protein
MPSLVYGDLRYSQTRHAIQCKKCLDTIESKHNYDYKRCSCGSVGIDGGITSANRLIGDINDMEDKSRYCAVVNKKKIYLPEEILVHLFEERKKRFNSPKLVHLPTNESA